ncbi:hypothetical protein IV203_007461 [Nitzschia inconspicua]|uniref:DUF6824 domain-containing protein n=1 Tax=Nitzschia inconspicua TaxID=303405 RepID=A0A9K3KEY7_9STRA|nr:hypothetical protein IV203_007461 [Nitzschia inconspicua]
MANFRVESNSFRFALQEHQLGETHVEISLRESPEDDDSSSKNILKTSVCKKNNSKKTRMPSDYLPPKNAVICGRGKVCTSNPGNRKLRALIKEYLQSYGKATNKVEKTEIVSNIMDSIKKDCGDQPAFVKKEEGVWWEVDDAFAREKIGCIFRDSLFTKYRSSTKAKLARRKQQVYEEEQIQQQQSHVTSGTFAGMGGNMDLASSFSVPSFVSYGMGANNTAKQLSQMLSFQGDLENISGMNHFLKQQQQQQIGLFSAQNSSIVHQNSTDRRVLLRHAPSMMGLPGGNQSSYMEPSVALGEVFDLLQNLQPAHNQTSQLLGGWQQKRETYFKDNFGDAFGPGAAPQAQTTPQASALQTQQPQSEVPTQPRQQKKSFASKSGKLNKSNSRKRRVGKNENDDLESLPDDISGIFD